MKPAILIICLIVFATGFALGTLLYQAWKEKKQLQKTRDDLIELVDWHMKEMNRYRSGDLKVELTLPERRIILNALESPQYKERVRDPATKRFIRIIYNTLREKIKKSIKEA